MELSVSSDRAGDRAGSHAGARLIGCAAVMLVLSLGGCQPTVKLQAPEEPIVINLNVKIEQEVRVKVERELDDVFRENSDIF